MHMTLHDLLGNNGVTKGWIGKDFIVNDPNFPDQLRSMNSNKDRFQIYLIKKNEIVHDKFMEISDFHCHKWINISSVTIVKASLDTLTARDFIEKDWEKSNEISTKKQNQYRLCYNLLLLACIFVGSDESLRYEGC